MTTTNPILDLSAAWCELFSAARADLTVESRHRVLDLAAAVSAAHKLMPHHCHQFDQGELVNELLAPLSEPSPAPAPIVPPCKPTPHPIPTSPGAPNAP